MVWLPSPQRPNPEISYGRALLVHFFRFCILLRLVLEYYIEGTYYPRGRIQAPSLKAGKQVCARWISKHRIICSECKAIILWIKQGAGGSQYTKSGIKCYEESRGQLKTFDTHDIFQKYSRINKTKRGLQRDWLGCLSFGNQKTEKVGNFVCASVCFKLSRKVIHIWVRWTKPWMQARSRYWKDCSYVSAAWLSAPSLHRTVGNCRVS